MLFFRAREQEEHAKCAQNTKNESYFTHIEFRFMDAKVGKIEQITKFWAKIVSLRFSIICSISQDLPLVKYCLHVDI